MIVKKIQVVALNSGNGNFNHCRRKKMMVTSYRFLVETFDQNVWLIRILASTVMGIYGWWLITGIASWCNSLVYSTGALGEGTSHVPQVPQLQSQVLCHNWGFATENSMCFFWGGDENNVDFKKEQEGEIILNANLLSGNGQLVLHMPFHAMSF